MRSSGEGIRICTVIRSLRFSCQGMRRMISAREKDLSDIDITAVQMINEFTKANIPTKNERGGKVDMCQALKELMADEWAEGMEKGTENGIDMMVSLLKIVIPGSEDYNLVINGTYSDRMKLLEKYGIFRAGYDENNKEVKK